MYCRLFVCSAVWRRFLAAAQLYLHTHALAWDATCPHKPQDVKRVRVSVCVMFGSSSTAVLLTLSTGSKTALGRRKQPVFTRCHSSTCAALLSAGDSVLRSILPEHVVRETAVTSGHSSLVRYQWQVVMDNSDVLSHPRHPPQSHSVSTCNVCMHCME